VLLPAILVFMLLLVNREALMGRFTNGRTSSVAAWGTVVVLIVLTALLVVTSFWPAMAEQAALLPLLCPFPEPCSVG
jgi:Mn2+/Fe2+ NRAMP family transporter